MKTQEIIKALRSTPSRSKRTLLDEAAKDELWFDTVAAWFEGYTGVDLWKDDWMEGK